MGKPDLINNHELITIDILTSKNCIFRSSFTSFNITYGISNSIFTSCEGNFRYQLALLISIVILLLVKM